MTYGPLGASAAIDSGAAITSNNHLTGGGRSRADLVTRKLPILLSLAAAIVAITFVLRNAGLGSIAAAIAQLSWSTAAVVLALFVAAALLASLRLWCIARDISSPISGRDAVIAISASSLAGALFFQIAAQVVARSTLLARRGTPVSASLIMTGYERAAALFVSMSFALAGAWYLFGKVSIDLDSGGANAIKIAAVGVLAIGAGAYLGWGRFVGLRLARGIWNPAFFRRVTRSLAISAAIQLCTMAAYLVLATSLTRNVGFFELASASAIVMLIASVPISFAGWGIRELSTVLALGAVGIAPEKAIVIALAIGVLSLVSLFLVLAVQFVRRPPRSPHTPFVVPTIEQPDFTTALAWFLPLATATAVFFQVHVPTAAGTMLNVNLADPFAITGGVLFLIAAVRDGQWPKWRVSWLNAQVILMTLAFMLALLIGVHAVGWTAWAFTSKYLGWYVLLAYALTGAMLCSNAGTVGLQVLLRTFIGVGIAVALFEDGHHLLRLLGLTSETLSVSLRATGVASNPNAFAFQLVAVTCAILAFIRSARAVTLSLAVILVAAWFTGSRAGLVTTLAVYAAAAALLPHRRLPIAYAIMLSAAIVVIAALFGWLFDWLSTSSIVPKKGSATVSSLLGQSSGPIASATSVSNLERWHTLVLGWQMFLENPLFGAGLGVFAETWRLAKGQVQVIHSTLLWLLAEFGVVGALFFIIPFARIVFGTLQQTLRGQRAATLAFLTCTAFATMSLVHELFYQRIFWFLLGAALIIPMRRHRKVVG